MTYLATTRRHGLNAMARVYCAVSGQLQDWHIASTEAEARAWVATNWPDAEILANEMETT